MRICFIDYTRWDYNVDAPTFRPLGGSQSALCYLAMELAKLGHEVTVMTGTERPDKVSGVKCLNIEQCHGLFFLSHIFDAVIVLNTSSSGGLRSVLPAATKLILWTQHDPMQPAMRKLSPEAGEQWDGIVCVSNWQRNEFIKVFDLKPERLSVMRNAIAPSFEGLFRSYEDLVRAKSNPLTLAYTSTPYRGLNLLLDIFPEFRRNTQEARLKVYSSMAVYPKHEAHDNGVFQPVYEALKAVDGVDYIGSLSQPALAERLAVSHVLAYPNIFPETSCIAVMEALAAGLRVVTSDLGALPETCEGFAQLVPIDIEADDASASIIVRNGTEYMNGFLQALAQASRTTTDLYEQVVHMNQHHTWAVRAKQWADYLNAA